jgi:tRNA modification GTPase
MSESTVVALLTPRASAALATFGILGSRARKIARSLFQSLGSSFDLDGRPKYGWFGAEVKDDVVLFVDGDADRSSVEVSCHGGAAITERLIADVVRQGARLVDWRAFERRRGRSEFQCDALAALSTATTARTAAVLLDQLNGALDRALNLSKADPSWAVEALRRSEVGRLLTRPARVVLFGLPNVGKSTLFNTLAGYTRLITSPVAGTTRDVVSEVVSMDGWPMELIDGAGFRSDASPLEAEGLQRLERILKTADLRVFVADSTAERALQRRLVERFRPQLIVRNKVDLAPNAAFDAEEIRCSAATGEGVVVLERTLAAALIPELPPLGAAVPFLPRHRKAFEARLRPKGV